jgi:hypothetical protein
LTNANWISLAQLIIGALTAALVPVVGWVVWTLGDHRDRLTKVETLARAESDDTARRFGDLERWMEKIDGKLERIAEKQAAEKKV